VQFIYFFFEDFFIRTVFLEEVFFIFFAGATFTTAGAGVDVLQESTQDGNPFTRRVITSGRQ